MKEASQDPTPIPVLLAATTGGHLTEGMKLLADLPGIRLVILSEASSRTRAIAGAYSYFRPCKGSVGAIIGGFLKGLSVILRERPRWVVTTGAECGLGALLAAKLLRKRTMFIETACRYRTRSKSAKMLYSLVNVFLVQHEEGLALFGRKAKYIGGLF